MIADMDGVAGKEGILFKFAEAAPYSGRCQPRAGGRLAALRITFHDAAHHLLATRS
jgi:hypothetical protein